MTINEVKQALGSWDIRLRSKTPRAVLDQLTYLGHIAVLPGRLNPSQYGDNLLSMARYVGVYRHLDAKDEFILKGSGMAFWLGDEDGKGDVFETPVNLTAQTFANSITALLPPSGSVTAGTLNSVAGTYTGKHQWETPRKAITYVADTFGAEWRVNGNGTLDAGTVSQLYVTSPKAILVPKASGRDLQRAAIPGRMSMESDVEDYTTRVVLLAEGDGASIATGSANAAVVPYKDIHGNVAKMTRLVSESGTSGVNANIRAQLALNLFSGKRNSVDLSTDVFDIKGDVAVGDYIDVWDPINGFMDPAREVYWEGQPLNPIALRCVEMSWPVPAGWTVAFRDTNGNWIDLSDYYAGEAGQTTIVVGNLGAALANVGAEPIGSRPIGDSTLPAAPAFTGFSTGAYQADHTTKSAIRAQWATPLNVDGSTILDGDHYEIRHRVSAVIGYQISWDVLAAYSWDDLGTWDALISEPVSVSPEWTTVYIGWGTNAFTINELSPGVTYEVQIRAVDAAIPPNRSAWSASSFVTTQGDLIAPSQPAVPVVAASRIAIQVLHSLGKSTGGTFNLELDIDHLDVHVAGSPSFFCDGSNKVGELIATPGMIQRQISAVGTFSIEQVSQVHVKVVAVDRSGNRSNASEAVTATAQLIDNAHISDLSVSKLTAGTITAQSVLAAEMEVASGGTLKLTEGSLDVFNSTGVKQVEIGKLSDATYGLAAVGPTGILTKLSDMVYGIKSDRDDGSLFLADTAGGWTGTSPAVTVSVGQSGRLLLIVTADLGVGGVTPFGGATAAYVSFEITGATSKSPDTLWSLSAYTGPDDIGVIIESGGASSLVYFVEGLNPGSHTVTLKYQAVGSNAAIERRKIFALPY